jgi:glycosyltransferase involved in cell wall biosynthesis
MIWASLGSPYALVGHIGYLPAAARIATIVEREGFDRVHAAWSHFPGSVGYLVSRLTGRRFSMSGHAGSDLYRTQAFLAEKVRAADFVATCVRGNAEMLRALAGVRAHVTCIYHGVDLRRFHGVVRERAPEPLLLCVGRLHYGKGFDDAVQALGHLARRGLRPKLVVVGDGPERGRLEDLARGLGVADQVEFRGVLPQEEIVGLYERAWLLIAPSRQLSNGRRDGVPNVIVEAMAMGVPCLGTHAGGLGEAIQQDQTGRLVESNDSAALAREIEALIGDPAKLETMGRLAQQRIRVSFDAEKNFEELFGLLMSDR